MLPNEGNKEVSDTLHEKCEAMANVQNISQNESKLTSPDNFYYRPIISNFTEMHSVVSEVKHTARHIVKRTQLPLKAFT
jgi:hypothetical protein